MIFSRAAMAARILSTARPMSLKMSGEESVAMSAERNDLTASSS